MDILILLGILAFVIAAFALEWLPLDVTAFVCLGLLLLFGLVTPEQGVAGFSNPAVVTVMMMFILSEGLVQSGAVRQIGYWIARLAGSSGRRASAGLLATTATLSGFINNTAAVSIFIPVALNLAKHYRFPAGKILIPLSYAAIFGGTCTLVGTSTNILVSALAVEHGLPPFSVFEFLYVGGAFLVIGLLYNIYVAMRLLPPRETPANLTEKYQLSEFLTEVRVPVGSRLVGKTVEGERLWDRFRVGVLEIIRGPQKLAGVLDDVAIEASDLLIVRGATEHLLAFKEQYRLLLPSDIKLSDADLADEDNILAEIQLAPNSKIAGATVKEIDFLRKYGCFVLAINRTGEVIRDKIRSIPLKPWDALLVFGPRSRVEGLFSGPSEFIPLQELSVRLRVSKRWWVGALTIPLVVVLAATGVMPILKSAVLGVALLLVTKAVRVQQAYRSVDWTVIFVLVGILPLGLAMEQTGLAGIVGETIVRIGQPWGPTVVLSLTILVTSIMTEFLTNNSAAVLMVPIVLSVANQLGIDPKPMLMGVAFAASMSFATPTGYQTNTMVYVPGGYRYLDYVKVGVPLNVLFWIVATLLIPLIWPF